VIKVYDDNVDNEKVKVFVITKEGKIHTVTIGNHAISKKAGIQFYVDKNVAEQLDKVDISINGFKPILELKEGQTIELPQKNEKEKEIERLERELRELRDAE